MSKTQPQRTEHLCYLPVCVELVCMVEQVEASNVTGGGSLNCFLLDKQSIFSCVLYIFEYICIYQIKYLINL